MTQPDRAPRSPAVQMIGFDNHSPDPTTHGGHSLTVLDRSTLLPVGTLHTDGSRWYTQWADGSDSDSGTWAEMSQDLSEKAGHIAVILFKGAPIVEPDRGTRWCYDGDLLAWDSTIELWRWTDLGSAISCAPGQPWSSITGVMADWRLEVLRLPVDGDTIHITRADSPDALLMVRDGALHPAEPVERVRVTPVRVARVHTDPNIEPDRDAQWRTSAGSLLTWRGEDAVAGWWIGNTRPVWPWHWHGADSRDRVQHIVPLVEVLPEDEPTANSSVAKSAYEVALGAVTVGLNGVSEAMQDGQHDQLLRAATAMPAGYEQRRTALRDAVDLCDGLASLGRTDLAGLAAWLLGQPAERQPRVFTSGADLPDTRGGLFRDAHGALLYAHGNNTWTWDKPDAKPWVGPPNSGELYVEVLDQTWEVPRG